MRHPARLILLAAAFQFTPSASAEERGEPTSQPAEIAAPFLWEVSGPAGPTYLFGTIHMGVTAAELPALVDERLRASQIAVFEADIRQANPFALMRAGMYPPGESLRDHIGSELWPALVEAVQPAIPETVLAQYRPWLLFVVITQSMFPLDEPMDLTLMNRAEVNLSQLRYLETPQQQTDMIASVPDQVMLDQIIDWVNDRDTVEAEAADLVDAYRSGDLERVINVVLKPEDMARWPALYDTLMFERNQNWISDIESLIAQGGGFVAVGLAHLAGEGSVIDLLRQRGHTVTRLRIEPATP